MMKPESEKETTTRTALRLARGFLIYSVLAVAFIYTVNEWPFGEIRAVYERY